MNEILDTKQHLGDQLKTINKEIINQRLNFIELFKAAIKSGHKIIQVNEFAVNRNTNPKKIWIK